MLHTHTRRQAALPLRPLLGGRPDVGDKDTSAPSRAHHHRHRGRPPAAAAAACVPPHARSPSAIWLPTTLTPQLPAQWRLDVMTLNCTMLSHLTAQEQTDAGSLVDGKNDVVSPSCPLSAVVVFIPGVQFPELLFAFFAEEQPCRGTPWESWLKIFSNFFFPKNFIKTLED
ncbi:hypothetical protein PAPYR_1938 [Paratrimastix pyriformis]|uniref:Uncharacterized protein n=1 Tax=Paratrimastix pyriformis TaxID=342808 RepID=A0ABQ8UVM5_9EUKA|nr:hypothetical protein PAPYR_1938 [Paratrimastix pyriformis]